MTTLVGGDEFKMSRARTSRSPKVSGTDTGRAETVLLLMIKQTPPLP